MHFFFIKQRVLTKYECSMSITVSKNVRVIPLHRYAFYVRIEKGGVCHRYHIYMIIIHIHFKRQECIRK